MSGPRPLSAPVRGGELAAAVWAPDAAPTILAIHGITSSHLAWRWLAAALPGVRILAPDLRGRGGSRALPGPWGMPQHAEDVLALLDAVGASRVLVVGHSMGAFVAGALAALAPERVGGLVLVDGGLPLPVPRAADGTPLVGAAAVEAQIGPAVRRLAETYPSREAYRGFWRAHPAFAGVADERLDAYADADLVGEPPRLRATASIDAVVEDSASLGDESAILARLDGWPDPIDLLRAPRGLLDEVPPLYPDEAVERWRRRLPRLRVHEIDDVNHYTILMSDAGVARVLPVLTAALEDMTERERT